MRYLWENRILKNLLHHCVSAPLGCVFSSGLCYFIFFSIYLRTLDIKTDPPSSTKASNIKILKASSGIFNFFLSKNSKIVNMFSLNYVILYLFFRKRGKNIVFNRLDYLIFILPYFCIIYGFRSNLIIISKRLIHL